MRLSFIAAITILSASIVARADTFKVVGPGIEDTFSLPATPTVSASGSYGFSVNQVPVDENGMLVSSNITFFSENLGGGLLIPNPTGSAVNPFGAQLYSGANAYPAFSVGTFSLAGLGNTYTVSVANAAVPEPGSFPLLAIGLLAVVGLVKHRLNSRRTCP